MPWFFNVMGFLIVAGFIIAAMGFTLPEDAGKEIIPGTVVVVMFTAVLVAFA